MAENKTTIALPDGISATYEKGLLTLSKSGKNSSKNMSEPAVEVKVEGSNVQLNPLNEKRKTIAILRSYAAHVRNMIQGFAKPYTYKLAIVNSHFPMNVKVNGPKLEVANYLGEKNPRFAKIIGDTKVEVKGKDITVSGVNIEDVSQTAANIENACRDTRKDQRVYQDGIYITQKGAQA